MTNFYQSKQKIIDLLTKTAALGRARGHRKVTQEIKQLFQTLNEKKFILATIGEIGQV